MAIKLKLLFFPILQPKYHWMNDWIQMNAHRMEWLDIYLCVFSVIFFFKTITGHNDCCSLNYVHPWWPTCNIDSKNTNLFKLHLVKSLFTPICMSLFLAKEFTSHCTFSQCALCVCVYIHVVYCKCSKKSMQKMTCKTLNFCFIYS